MFNPCNYKLIYTLDEIKKTFAQYRLQTAEKELLPELVRIEKNNGYNFITGANNLLRIRNATNWTKCELTGLRATRTPHFYYADLLIKSKKSLCIIWYNPETENLMIRVFPQFYPFVKPELIKLVNSVIQNF